MKDIKNLTEIYVSIDDFYKQFERDLKKYQLATVKRMRQRKFNLSNSEIMTILVLFHLSHYRDLKSFYLFYVCKQLRSEFPRTVSYNRFVELSQTVILPLAIYLKKRTLGQCTGISFIDSTPLRVFATIAEFIPIKSSKGLLRGAIAVLDGSSDLNYT